jgi:MaoC like domain
MSDKVVISTVAELKTWIGKEVAAGKWITVTQDLINKFAEASGDFQWIHVDVERCKKESPFKTTIAHGNLTTGRTRTTRFKRTAAQIGSPTRVCRQFARLHWASSAGFLPLRTSARSGAGPGREGPRPTQRPLTPALRARAARRCPSYRTC